MARVNYEKQARKAVIANYQQMNSRCPNLARYARNLNLLYMEDKIDPVYHRDKELVDMQKILLRKGKANILLTGLAGCGKTAIVEGLAGALAEKALSYERDYAEAKKAYDKAYKKWADDPDNLINMTKPPEMPTIVKPLLVDYIIYDLSISSLVGGTKYRGEFEERIEGILSECKSNPQVIVFIDEVHQIVKAGATEGNEGAAQMLKPALARKDIRLIGATTTDEVKSIKEDKALTRRFSEIQVLPLTGDSATETAESIMKNYSAFHNVATVGVSAENLLAQIQFFLPNSVFPDNFINLVDETFAGAVFDGVATVNMSHFNATLSRMCGKVII